MDKFLQGALFELRKGGVTNIIGTSHVQPMQAKLREAAPHVSATIGIKGTQQLKSPVAAQKR